jgi:putative membrane protein
MTKYVTLTAILTFIGYSVASLGLLSVFGLIYQRLTPYSELEQIRAGKCAPALAMGGALLGFMFPILSMMHYGANFIDFVIWASVGGAFQVIVFKVLYWVMPMQIESDNKAIGILYAALALCVGLSNAFALIPG